MPTTGFPLSVRHNDVHGCPAKLTDTKVKTSMIWKAHIIANYFVNKTIFTSHSRLKIPLWGWLIRGGWLNKRGKLIKFCREAANKISPIFTHFTKILSDFGVFGLYNGPKCE